MTTLSCVQSPVLTLALFQYVSRPPPPLIRCSSTDPVLPESGNLQTIILIQIVTSLFERLETLLGLPREFRIGGREPECPGLFGQQGFMETARPIMRNEEIGAMDHGKGGVEALRRHIRKTKQLLKESIAP